MPAQHAEFERIPQHDIGVLIVKRLVGLVVGVDEEIVLGLVDQAAIAKELQVLGGHLFGDMATVGRPGDFAPESRQSLSSSHHPSQPRA